MQTKATAPNGGERNAEYTANLYALHCLCITMVAFFGIWLLTVTDIFIVSTRMVTAGICAALVLLSACLISCRLLGLAGKATKYILMLFTVAITTVIGTLLTYHAVVISLFPIIYSAMYPQSRGIQLYTYILTVISTFIIVLVGYRVGVCDANMVLLTCEPLAAYLSDTGQFLLNHVNDAPLLTLSLYYVLPRCVLYALAMPVTYNISRITWQTKEEEKVLLARVETDSMTGLYSKSKYTEDVAAMQTEAGPVAVIFWDVNGLKTVNDTLGHDCGDRLIIAVSDGIRSLTSAADIAYRVGGDEFLMILHGGDAAAAQEKIRLWQAAVAGRCIGPHPVTASVGYACGSAADIETVIRSADEQMYEVKREYHRSRDAAAL